MKVHAQELSQGPTPPETWPETSVLPLLKLTNELRHWGQDSFKQEHYLIGQSCPALARKVYEEIIEKGRKQMERLQMLDGINREVGREQDLP